jgi:hypothetical protein
MVRQTVSSGYGLSFGGRSSPGPVIVGPRVSARRNGCSLVAGNESGHSRSTGILKTSTMAKPATIKTKENDASVDAFLNGLADEQQRADSRTLVELMEGATNQKPKMWGALLVGFGSVRYKSPRSGREVDWFRIGFSPRKANLSLHLVLTLEKHATILQRLGKHKTGTGCLYINRLADVDLAVLKELIAIAAREKGVE